MSQRVAPHHTSLVVSSTVETRDGRPIQLHYFDLDRVSASEIESLTCEIEKAARFHFTRDADYFLIRRAVLRSLVAELNDLKPADVQLVSEGGERPWIPELPDFEFNTSRSGSRFIVATSHEVIPGVDVESERGIPDLVSLMNRICSPKERAEIEADDPISAEWFLHLWTRKESVLKALGLGLKLDPARVSVPTQNAPLNDWSPTSTCSSSSLQEVEIINPSNLPNGIICSLAVQVPARSARRSD